LADKMLSKTKYLYGLQCPKYLWAYYHEPESIPPPDNETLHLFDQGHRVGRLAKGLFPEGIDVPTTNSSINIACTQELIQQRKALFEAGIIIDELYSRIDIFNPTGEDAWEIIEVKSSTSVKEVNIHDVSFQKYCCTRAG